MTETTMTVEALEMNATVVITLKGDGSPPWIVVHGGDGPAASDAVEYCRATDMFPAVQQANAEFAAARKIPDMATAVANVQAAMPGSTVIGTEPNQWPAGSIGASYGGQQLPQQFQPGGQAQACIHGPMNYVANGQYGPFWACPLPKGTPGKCKSRNAR